MNPNDRWSRLPLIGWVLRYRFPRFGVVGASGTLVNLLVLFIGQEWLFRSIEPASERLNFSLPLAVFVATVNNFTWNRIWTWGDRRGHAPRNLVMQFGQYAIACWVGILLQFVITKVLVAYIHYLVANLLAIVIASAVNFIVNDHWTFRKLRAVLPRS